MKQNEKEQIVSQFENKSYRKRKFFNVFTAIIGIFLIICGVVFIALNKKPLMIVGFILSLLGVVTIIVSAIYASKNPDL